MTGARLSLLFLALARNCRTTLDSAWSTLTALTAHDGVDAHMIIGENGSSDGSRRHILRAAERGVPVSLVDTEAMSRKPSRLERMATGRQMLLNEAQSMRHRSFTHVVVTDVDEPFLGSLQPQAIIDSVNRLNDDTIFAVSATSRPTYYDLLAYQDQRVSFADLDAQITATRSSPLAYYRFFTKFIYPTQRLLTSDSPIFCYSSFNGLAIYRYADYTRFGTYTHPNLSSAKVCEHVHMNLSLREKTGGSVVIDPRLVLPAPPEHVRQSAGRFMWSRSLKLLATLSARSRAELLRIH